MHINIYLILIIVISVIVLMWFMTHGFKKGLAHEISTLFSMGCAVACLYYISKLVSNFLGAHFSGIINAVIMLAVTVVLYKIFHIFFAAINIIARAPIISWLDKGLGLVIGLAEGFIFLYAVQFLLEHYILR
ncbi:MAG: CvpA family protein [Lachnospiraceae bacterium]|jgi:uncharacterized membrane protein required for colicin V production|nr:CvpA family protein [Lachnospiraceae bacterium]